MQWGCQQQQRGKTALCSPAWNQTHIQSVLSVRNTITLFYFRAVFNAIKFHNEKLFLDLAFKNSTSMCEKHAYSSMLIKIINAGGGVESPQHSNENWLEHFRQHITLILLLYIIKNKNVEMTTVKENRISVFG